MKICVNGEKESIPLVASVADLLATRGNDENRVVVERNGDIVPRGNFAATSLQEGDTLEIVHFVGGG
ncbi:MAG: sulfur carrier protein ThiS [Desulfovibrio sp.]|jgi:thiamine biosynthesis protein ThiS|nr:sulfur carrier protein ThiS [Desulfovibrio sp.]